MTLVTPAEVHALATEFPAAHAPSSPTLAEVIRQFGPAYRRRHGDHISVPQDRAMRELEICRTPVLGGHLRHCDACGHSEPFYHSCRNRHCPQCSGFPRRKWYQERLAEVLPVPYYHLVFTLPATLSELALDNPALLYNLLFTAASQALLHVGRTWSPLRAETGFIGVLHTWGQLLWVHIHLHVLWIGGGLARDGSVWRALPQGFCLPKEWLCDEFRTRFLAGLERAYDDGTLVLRGRHGHLFAPAAFAAWIEGLKTTFWNLHAEPVDVGRAAEQTPEEAAERTLGYLARYASGVALRNNRLLAIEGDEVVFSYQDYRDHGRRKQMSLPGVELLERFLQHVLPPQTRHIRHYGFLSPNQRGEKLPLIRRLLGCSPREEEAATGEGDLRCQEEDAGHKCPRCGQGELVVREIHARPTVAEIMRLPLQALRQYRLPFS